MCRPNFNFSEMHAQLHCQVTKGTTAFDVLQGKVEMKQ